jgi:hypothetical protein
MFRIRETSVWIVDRLLNIEGLCSRRCQMRVMWLHLLLMVQWFPTIVRQREPLFLHLDFTSFKKILFSNTVLARLKGAVSEEFLRSKWFVLMDSLSENNCPHKAGRGVSITLGVASMINLRKTLKALVLLKCRVSQISGNMWQEKRQIIMSRQSLSRPSSISLRQVVWVWATKLCPCLCPLRHLEGIWRPWWKVRPPPTNPSRLSL